mgnify:FL=1
MTGQRVQLSLPAAHEGAVWHYRNAGVRYPMHRHVELEFNLVLRGRAAYLLDDRRYELSRHSTVWLFPTQSHLLLDQTPDYEMWILVFRPALVRRLALPIKPSTAACRELGAGPAQRQAALFGEVEGAVADPVRFNAGLAYALCTAWAAHQQTTATTFGDTVHPAVERAAKVLRDDPSHRLTEVARNAGLSPSRLSRLFREQTGVALVDYRNRQRLERFLALYRPGQRHTITEAALAAGFGSYPQFHRVFTRLLGCSPKDYIRR